jgi:chromatin remodeling complex protein RSC6
MVRASKTPVVEKVVVEKVVAETPELSTTKKPRAPKVKSVTPVEVSEPTPTPTPVFLEPVIPANEVIASLEEVVAASVEIPTLSVKLTEFGAKLQQCTILLSAAKSDYKLLEKFIAKNEKLALKNSHRKKKASGNRAPSGFVKPTLITDELATFLGMTHGTLLARTEVSKEINRYIRENSLQDKENGRKIIPDAKLTTLLKIKEGDELTYFNLQKFMKHHFIKEVKPVADVAV